MRDNLGIDPNTIKWSLNPEYENHNWCRKDPNLVTPDPLYQIGIGLANNESVGVEACTGSGKTFIAAALALWFVDCWQKILDEEGNIIQEGGLVVTVATKAQQLREVLWKEIGNFKGRFSNLHPQAEWLDLKLRMDPDGETGSKEGWGITGITASVGANEDISSKFKGIHAQHMLFIMDEGQGIHKAKLEAIDNTCTGIHNLQLMLGNPESVNDTLREFCERPSVRHLRASAMDHPNIVKNKEYIPGAVTRRSVDRRFEKYADPDHRLILSNVYGVSPATSGRSMFTKKISQEIKEYSEIEPVYEEKEVPGHEDGYLRVYRETKHTHLNRYVVFADVAGDRSDAGDWHAAVVLDRMSKSVCAVLRMRATRHEYITKLLELCDRFTIKYGGSARTETELYAQSPGFAKKGVERNRKPEGKDDRRLFKPLFAFERNNVGGLHLDTRIYNYPNLYHKRSTDRVVENERESVGWHTNKTTRPDMMNALEDWAQTLVNKPDRFRDSYMYQEAITFVYNGNKKRWEADTGCHDDVIMALSGTLAVDQILKSTRFIETSKYESDKEDRRSKAKPKLIDDFKHTSKADMFDASLPNSFA